MYQIREVELRNGSQYKKRLVIEFNDSKMQIVGEFLMADAPIIGGQILKEIDNVLEGKQDFIESSGNRTHLIVGPEYTKIEDLFDFVEEVSEYPTFNIKTKMLRELIIMWFAELNKS